MSETRPKGIRKATRDRHAARRDWLAIERWLDAVTDNLRQAPRSLELKPVRVSPHPWRVVLDDGEEHAFEGADRLGALHEAADWCATELNKGAS